MALSSGASARTFTVNSTTDAVDANPGDGVCETAAGNRICTLRAAIMESNNRIGPNTINLPAGVYTLTIPGAGEDAAASGDLDITNFLTIVGGGRDVTVVDAGGLDRAFDVININVSISNLTVKRGQRSGEYGGGILAHSFGIITLEQVTLVDNHAVIGGALMSNGAVLQLINVDINNLDSATFAVEGLRRKALWGLIGAGVDPVAQEFREGGLRGASSEKFGETGA